MAQGLSATQNLALLATTLNHYERDNFTSTFARDKYTVLAHMLRRNKLRKGTGAEGYELNIRVDENYSARGTRMYAKSTATQTDTIRRCLFPWVIDEASYVIESREMARNKGGARLVDLIKAREEECAESIANRLESAFLLPPANATDDLNPQGLMFHLRKLGTGQQAPTGGFFGQTALYGDGTTTNLFGGRHDTTLARNSRLANYVFTHNGVFDSTLKRQLRRAMEKSEFRAPSGIANLPASAPRDFAILLPDDLYFQYEDAVNSGPDDKQGNMVRFFGDLPFGPSVIKRTPSLNDVADVSILGVDFNSIELAVLEGQWMVKDEPTRAEGTRTTFVVGIDSQYAVVNRNPRGTFIGHTPR